MDIVGISLEEQVGFTRIFFFNLISSINGKMVSLCNVFPYVGGYLSSCGFYTPSRKHWLHSREGSRFFCTEKWEVTVPLENHGWAINVRHMRTLICATIHLVSFLKFFIILLFRCDSKSLLEALSTRIIVTRDENITKQLDPVSATINRDTLAKTVYSRLFDW